MRRIWRTLLMLCITLCLLGAAMPAETMAAGSNAKTAGPVIKRSGNRYELAKKKKKKSKNNNNKNNNSNNNNNNSNNSNKDNNNSNSSNNGGSNKSSDAPGNTAGTVSEDGTYTSKEEVAEYLHLYGHLPDNYITKNEAKDLGWVNSEGNLDEVAPGKSIGGDYFGNYEGQLPTAKGRKYYECDIDYTGGYRNQKRIIFSGDGLIYYTEDHYNTFERLY